MLNSLPFVLKHTLFLEHKVMNSMREITDVGQLFFITDDVKIKGNRSYDGGRYYEALDAYEQVLGCFLWLEAKEDRAAFEERVFHAAKFEGVRDEDVELKEKEIVREEDKEIETETSKSSIHNVSYRTFHDPGSALQLNAGLYEHASLRRGCQNCGRDSITWFLERP